MPLSNMPSETLQALIDAARDATTCGHSGHAWSWSRTKGCTLPHCGLPGCRICPGKHLPLEPRVEMVRLLRPYQETFLADIERFQNKLYQAVALNLGQ